MNRNSCRQASLFHLVVAVTCAAACSNQDKEDIVATVGDLVLTRSDLAIVDARTGDRDAALTALIDSATLAEGARRRGLLDDPKVTARVEAARREALGAALLERAMTDAATDSALRSRYEANKQRLERRRVHVAHVVVHDGDGAQAKIAAVLARLRAGDAFEVVARELSADAASAARGGELPPIEAGQTDAAFFAAAEKLQAGETSDVVKTPFGMHVIRAIESPQTVVPTFEQARSQLAAEAMGEARKALLEELRRQVAVTRPTSLPELREKEATSLAP